MWCWRGATLERKKSKKLNENDWIVHSDYVENCSLLTLLQWIIESIHNALVKNAISLKSNLTNLWINQNLYTYNYNRVKHGDELLVQQTKLNCLMCANLALEKSMIQHTKKSCPTHWPHVPNKHPQDPTQIT